MHIISVYYLYKSCNNRYIYITIENVNFFVNLLNYKYVNFLEKEKNVQISVSRRS
jgi:hypothetical protein